MNLSPARRLSDLLLLPQERKEFFAFFVTPTLPAPCGVVASARLCCLSRVPPAVCPSLLESAATAVCTSFLRSLSTYVHTPTPHSILRFRPAPQTPDLHTSNLPPLRFTKTKKSRRYGSKTQSGTSHGVSIFVKPTQSKKKTGRETLLLAIPQVEFHSEFHEKRNFDRYSWFCAQRSILS